MRGMRLQESFEEYLEEFTRTILEITKRERLDEELVGFVKDVERISNYILKIRKTPKAERDATGREISRFEWTTQPATPERIYLSFPLGSWRYRPNEIDMIPYMNQAGRMIAQRENIAIVKGLLSSVGEEFTDGHTKEKVREAINWIAESEHYPDLLLIHPMDRALLEKEGVIVPIWQLPQDFRKQKGSHFLGMSEGALDVHWMSWEELRGTAIMYEKSGITLERTPLRIHFDNNKDHLIVDEERISWSTDEKSVAKMNFNTAIIS